MPTARARLEWKNRAVAEYTSAATAARVLHLAIACGLPRDLLDVASRIVTDELDHAALSDAVRRAWGDDSPVQIEAENLEGGRPGDGPLAALVDEVVPSFCVGETLAVPLFSAMREGAAEPAVVAALRRILQDEAVHRKFGWDALDAALALDQDGVRARATAGLQGWISAFRSSYHSPAFAAPAPDPLLDIEVQAGLLDLHRYADVFDTTLNETILPRFAARGIAP